MAPKAPVEGAWPAPNPEEGAELKTNGDDVEVGAGGAGSRGTLTLSFMCIDKQLEGCLTPISPL